ncbi:MAG: DUF58 domain-containing protein [Planctomycetota bacterium]
MHDSKRFLHPDAIKRITRLEMRARHVVEGFLAGMHRSPYFGQSIEFRQHREYTFGDDPRHIDWKLWAKQDRYYVKQFEEDTNLRATLLVDVSGSMRYGRGAMNKFEYGATIACSLAYLLLRQQDSVGCVSFDEKARMIVPLRAKRNHLESIVQALEVSAPRDKTDLYPILREVAETFPRRGMMILVSDLFSPRDGLFRGLKLLRSRGHDVMVFHLLDDDELDFPFTGPTRFEGLEMPDIVRCNPRALREGYLKAMQAYLEEVRRGCTRNNVDYVLLRTSQPLDAALAAFLSNRLGMHHRNRT